ncbi:hypothetical protein REPUB_Repub16aG0093400 [Reevesia pubescens]
MNMSPEATPSLSATAGCNLHLKPPPLEQPVCLIADHSAACSLWDSAAFSVDTNSFNRQHGCAIANNRSLEQFTSTGAVDKAAPANYERYITYSSTSCGIDLQSTSYGIDLQYYSTGMDARGLILFLCEHVEDHDLMHCEISDALQLAPDPAKLVLDAISTFYLLKSEDGFNTGALGKVRQSCILLLEQLKTFPFQIEPHVNEEVLKLAVDSEKYDGIWCG